MLAFVTRRAIPRNYERAATEFLRAIRAERSQRALARKLGYRGNPITDWEHGRRFPTAEEALRAARLVGVNLKESFRQFHPAPIHWQEDGSFAVSQWLDAIRGSTPNADIAHRAGLSRFAVSRFLRGTAHPRVPDFFSLIDSATGRLPDFVAAMVPIDRVPSLKRRHSAALAARRAAYDAPWTEAILRVLESPAYASLSKHDDTWIARRLGISIEQVRVSISLLKRSRVIRRSERGFRVRDISSVDTRGDPSGVNALLTHWSGVACARIPVRRPGDLLAYNVCSLAEADFKQAREILLRAFREVRSLAAASSPAERVTLINVQLIALDSGSQMELTRLAEQVVET
jgi:transcriptional regulator with XRE-family HTH domain